MNRHDFRSLTRIEVRWAEVDAQKIVFNAHYLMYADVAITNYWRQLAIPYESGFAALGGELFVKKATTTYHASATLGDVLDVGIRCVKQGNTSVQFEAGIFRGMDLLNTVELVYVFADPTTQTPKPLPQELRDVLTAYEAGQEVVSLRSGSWNELSRDAERLRLAVFVREQGVPREIEIDALDPVARHVVLFNALNQPVAAGRLVTDAPGAGRIGRMAVDRSVRGGRWGRMVLDSLIEAARERGDKEVVLHAQRHAEVFYLRAGFTVVGEPYEEAGIPHITMRKSL
ncbi:YbgC/FadM family acyl-CoA thioesterase [Comamonas testosteroni]|uniref:YbgC/FadM family acyl-CoA thioesterase n=1 Tax=Comamonas testosteroni TaxID=285 RepID=A0A373FMM0_COMTE|nr:YbgC/FadM family acyl-CoA thioesterase [Comamonas testosteroni]RGE45421.1 YbgC/FadM family acyl-CoA thioesterase [Comamonas testosteroni]